MCKYSTLLTFLFLCFVIQLTQLPAKHITSSCIIVAWRLYIKASALPVTKTISSPKSKFKSRLVLESLELSIHQVKSRKSSDAYCHTVTHHTSHSFSYLSSLPLVTDPIAIALNDCARDHLHKDRCTQAFGRNTLRKPHTAPPSSTIPSVPKVHSYFCHISNTPPFVPVPLVSPFIPMFPVSLISVSMPL